MDTEGTAKVPETANPVPATGGIQSVHIDGGLYVAIGFLTALLVCLDSDNAVKLIAPATLWWMQTIAESLNGGLLALKMFRSTSFSDSKK